RQEPRLHCLSQSKKSAPRRSHRQSHPYHQRFPGHNRLVGSRLIALSPVALPLAGLVLRRFLDSAATAPRRPHRESDRIWREANAPLPLAMTLRLPSSRAIHLLRSDTADRERCLPVRRGFAAATRVRCSVLRSRPGEISALYRAMKARLESFAANRALLPP